MKNFKNKKIILIVILVLLALIAIVLGIVLSSDNSEKGSGGSAEKEGVINNLYEFSDEVVEPDGTEVIRNESMSSEHCLKNICVTDAVFYTNGEEGRVECNVWNNTKKTVSGYLKLNFGSNSLIISYKNLKPNTSAQAIAGFRDVKFENVEDFVLEELTEEEISNIITE